MVDDLTKEESPLGQIEDDVIVDRERTVPSLAEVLDLFATSREHVESIDVKKREEQTGSWSFVVKRGGKRHRGNGRVNSEYYCFGLPIVAPAAGRIVWLSAGVHDNRPGQTNARQPIGNGVVLDHGAGEFSVMAHFQRDSLTVKLGQVVAAGDTLGRCGNSGKSTEPHLHYHLQDGPVPLEGDGLPAFFHGYQAAGKLVEKGEPSRGQYVSRQ